MTKEQELGIDAVIRGELSEFKTRACSPSDFVDYVTRVWRDGRRIDLGTAMSTNGWQWDYWIVFQVDGEYFTIAGSGYYGGVEISQGGEDMVE